MAPRVRPEFRPVRLAAPAGTHGETGQVTKITPDGQQSVLVTGLTSYNFMGEVVGPAGVVVGKSGTIYVSIGGPGPGTAQFVPAGNADSVVSVDSSGTVTELANIGQYERDNNPDPNAVDSNVGGMAMGSDGLLYVADSGGNDLYSVDPSTGELKLVAVFPGLPSVDGAPNPARGNKPEVDPVPTDVTRRSQRRRLCRFADRRRAVGQPGSAKVIHVAADGKIEDAVTGLNMVTGVAQERLDDLRERAVDQLHEPHRRSRVEVAMAAIGGYARDRLHRPGAAVWHRADA